MIRFIAEGDYSLIETKGQTKILILDASVFAWVPVADMNEILIASHKKHKTDHILSLGNYRMYDVKDEPKLSDHIHLELSVGKGEWQGYLLLTGLPTEAKKRSRIVPTHEIISRSSTHTYNTGIDE